MPRISPLPLAPSTIPRRTGPHAPLVPLPENAPLRIKELLPMQIEAVMAGDPRLIIPVGTCEQHGPHLPLGTATIIAERLADDLSAEFGVLRAPAVEYGVNVDTERGFIGNASVRKKTLHRTAQRSSRLMGSDGVQGIHSSHRARSRSHQEALATVITAGARVRVVDIFAVNLSELLEGQTEAMHGDEVDTSIMLHLAPEMVHLELARDYMMSREELRRYRRGTSEGSGNSAGSIGLPSLASAKRDGFSTRESVANQRPNLPRARTDRVKIDPETLSGVHRTLT